MYFNIYYLIYVISLPRHALTPPCSKTPPSLTRLIARGWDEQKQEWFLQWKPVAWVHMGGCGGGEDDCG